MKLWIILFTIGEGPAALIAALLCALMRTEDRHWPKLFRALSVWFAAIAVARFGSLWNVVAHRDGVVLPFDYLWWAIAIAAAQAFLTWTAVIILLLSVTDVSPGRLLRRVIKRSN